MNHFFELAWSPDRKDAYVRIKSRMYNNKGDIMVTPREQSFDGLDEAICRLETELARLRAESRGRFE